MTRVTGEPAYLLHHHDWSESSLILEVFTRTRGRVVLVAKGVKRPSSSFRPVLLPMQLLLLSWSSKGEIGTLKSVEWGGGPSMPGGQALLSGYYANELVLRMLAREDAHSVFFDDYASLMNLLAVPESDAWAAAGLRAFELLLLRAVGYLPALDKQTTTQLALLDQGHYGLTAALGLSESNAEHKTSLRGADWRSLAAALHSQEAFTNVLTLLNGWPNSQRTRLRTQLQAVIDDHCGPHAELRTRRLMASIRHLTIVNGQNATGLRSRVSFAAR